MGHLPFDFSFYIRRHDREVTYTLTHMSTGWHVQHIAINGDCKPDGAPVIYENFDQDFVAYPSAFGSFLEHVWSGLANGELAVSDARLRIHDLAQWVSICERAQPEWKGWNA